MIYGYCRVSTSHQKIIRQITNIRELYPKATLIREFYTGTTQQRPLWEKMISQLHKGDTVVFDSVSRMSRNSEEGFNDYKKLYEMGVNLVFLNEPLINTSVFDSTKDNLLKVSVETGNKAVDEYFSGNVQLINKLLMSLAEQQIKTAFDQSEKEVNDLHTRISEGLRESRKSGKVFGMPLGAKIKTRKEVQCVELINKHSKDFGGSLNDIDLIRLCGCSRNTFYKYKRNLKQSIC